MFVLGTSIDARKCAVNVNMLKQSLSVGALCILSLLAAALIAPEQTVHACSIAASDPRLDTVPANGDIGVPTDVVIFSFTPWAVLSLPSPAGTFTLQSEQGEAVPMEARKAGVWNVELVPQRHLAARTRYVLRASWTMLEQTFEDQIAFVTGDGPLTVSPPEPNAWMEVWKVTDDATSNSCGQAGNGMCLAVRDDRLLVEYRILYPGASELPNKAQQTRGSVAVGLGQSAFEDPESYCMMLRTRALNGTYSAAKRVCGSSEVRVDNNLELTCDANGVHSPHTVGCSVAIGAQRGPVHLASVAFLCITLALLRRSNRRKSRASTCDQRTESCL